MTRKLRTSMARIDSPAIPGTGLTDLALSAVFAGGFMLLLSLSISVTIWAIWKPPVINLVLGSVVLALFSAGGLGFYRMLAVERDDRVTTQERQRRRTFEDADWGMAEDIHTDVTMGREPNASRLDAVARTMMRRYYSKKSISRKACTEAAICTHAEWNRVNALLLSRGIRTGRLLTPRSYSMALVSWYEGERKAASFRFVEGEPVAKV